MGKSKNDGKNPNKNKKIQAELLLEDSAPVDGNDIVMKEGVESGAGATHSTNDPPPALHGKGGTTPGNAGEPAQTPSPIDIDSTDEGRSEDSDEVHPVKPPMVLLVNDHKGCWKQLEGEERIKLSEKEWRMELTRHFKRSVHAPEAQ